MLTNPSPRELSVHWFWWPILPFFEVGVYTLKWIIIGLVFIAVTAALWFQERFFDMNQMKRDAIGR